MNAAVVIIWARAGSGSICLQEFILGRIALEVSDMQQGRAVRWKPPNRPVMTEPPFWRSHWFSVPDDGHRIRQTVWPQEGHEWNFQGEVSTRQTHPQQDTQVRWRLFERGFWPQQLLQPIPSSFIFHLFFLQFEKGDKKAGSGWMRLRGANCGHGFCLLWKAGSSGQTEQAEPEAVRRRLRPFGGQDRRGSEKTGG